MTDEPSYSLKIDKKLLLLQKREFCSWPNTVKVVRFHIVIELGKCLSK